jgi:hypothetical protein
MVNFWVNPVGIANAEGTEVNADDNATVSDVINQLVDAKKVPKGRYMLQHAGHSLNPSQKIKNTGIKEGEEAKLMVDTRWGA